MKHEKVNFKDLPTHNGLPESFYPKGITRKQRTTKEIEFPAVNTETGQVFSIKPMSTSFEIDYDAASYTKVFRNNADVLRDMSIPAHNLFNYIVQNLSVHKAYIYVSERDFLKAAGYNESSRKNYYSAVTELINKGIIAKKADGYKSYWINTNVVFNGDRTKVKYHSENPTD